jgi:hypothetical protein
MSPERTSEADPRARAELGPSHRGRCCGETELLARLRRDAERIAARFGLDYRAIQAENVKSRYGVCFADGLIKVRLTHATTGRPLKYSSLIDTVCHELAHRRHFNHGPEFKAFFFELLGWARAEGIYRPGPPGGARAQREATAAPRFPLPPPARRNGVPVFPPEPAPRGDGALPPWERWRQLLGAAPSAPASRPHVSRAPAPQPRPEAPRQLCLF